MFTAIFQAIVALLQAIPVLERIFKKSATDKVEEKKKDVREEMDDFRRTGRPPA